jgi:hypothetical protein
MRPRDPKKGKAWAASAVFVIPSVLALLAIGMHWAQPPTVVAQIDLPPPFGLSETLRKCAFAWGDVHSYFGSVDNCSSWYPYTLILLAFDAVFGPSLGQALTFIVPVIVSWIGAFAVARAAGASPAASFIAAWVYAFNPMRQSMFGEYATGEACAAIMPWIWYWIIATAREPARAGRGRAVLAAIAFAPLSMLAATPQLLVALILGSLLLAWIADVVWASDKPAFRRWLASSIVAGLVVSLWWTVPNVSSYVGVSVGHPVSPASVAWTFGRASLMNEMRFCASWVWQYAEYNPWAIEFEANPWMFASGFIAIAWLIAALAFCRGTALRVARAVGLVSLAMLFIAKGPHPPLAGINLAFYSIPGMFLLLEPDGPIMVAALSLSLCAAIGSDAMLRSQNASFKRLGVVAVAVTLVGLCWNNLAAITGAVFHEKTVITPGEHIVLASDWTDAARYLNDTASRPGGVVVLPPDDHYEADYSWGYRGIDVLAQELFDRDVLMPGAPFWYTQRPEAASLDAVIDRLVALHSPLARTLLLELGVRYAVVRDDVHPVADGIAPEPGEDRSFLGAPAATFGAIEIYDLGDPTPRLAQLKDARHEAGDPGDAALMRATGAPADSVRREATTAALRPARVLRLVPSNAFSLIDEPVAEAFPKLVDRSSVDATTVSYTAINPTTSDMTAEIDVGVWPRAPTTYSLTVDSQATHTAIVRSTSGASWAKFVGVVLRPGLNRLVLRWPPTWANTFAAFFPPRFAQGQPWQPNVYQMMIQDVRSSKSSPNPLKGVRVYLPLIDDPVVDVEPESSEARPTRMTAIVSDGVRRFACLDQFTAGAPKHLTTSIRDCEQGAGRRFTDVDARRDRVIALELYEPIGVAPKPVVIDISTEPSQRAFVRGEPRRTSSPPPLGTSNGLGAIVRISEDPSPLVLAQTFSSSWVACDVSHWRLLPHWEAFGWSNAWTVSPTSTIVVVNLLSALTLLLLSADVLVLVWLSCRR